MWFLPLLAKAMMDLFSCLLLKEGQVLKNTQPQQWEARAPQRGVAPRLQHLEKARAQQRGPSAAKNK